MPHATPASSPIDWHGLDALKFADEPALLAQILASTPLDATTRQAAEAEARELVRKARALARRKGVMESFLEEFGLSNREGLALMCLAEALLRVPDTETADALIAEKIRSGSWDDHRGKSDSLLVNASTWGLMLTGRVVDLGDDLHKDVRSFMGRLVARAGEPVIRAAMMQAMRIMGEQFVLGRTISAANQRGQGLIRAGTATSFSFDMLGEGARTAADAQRYFAAYGDAIDAVGQSAGARGPIDASGISVKLSALHPRYEARLPQRAMSELLPMVAALARKAKAHNIGFCLDAEETDRLVLSLELFEQLARDPSLAGWDGLGLAVQAYQKRARGVIANLIQLARFTQRRLMVRLVKGAYWDGEIKRAQIMGRTDYPVFTTKPATDLSYLACARDMLAAPDAVFAQFATHNAHTLAAIRRMAQGAGGVDHEFQRLHGMGEALYQVAQAPRVRVYAPVGTHEDLLPYLVRRLLENGANTSFVHSFLDLDVAPERIAQDPITLVEASGRRHPRLPVPGAMFGPSRRNSAGRDLTRRSELEAMGNAIGRRLTKVEQIGPADAPGLQEVRSPGDNARLVGRCAPTDPADLPQVFAQAQAAQKNWNGLGGLERARILRAMGDKVESQMDDLVALMSLEAGKTLADCIDEVREAVDFCRYYASEAERQFGAPVRLPGPAGETNHLELMGRGVFACISPWNFPLAIFAGQIAAALAAGNCVIAKPADQTPLVASRAQTLFVEAGLPANVLQLVYGGPALGAALSGLAGLAGIAFTGSTATAQAINRTLAARTGPIATLIAETGGLNAMFVDTSALAEQVVDDALVSAFGSAGQRCSALRLLYLPHETADLIIEKLTGAMAQLRLGLPWDVRTDIGPIIDEAAKGRLEAHLAAMQAAGAKVLARAPLDPQLAAQGPFFAPTLLELPDPDLLQQETFGPILHVVRYDVDHVEAMGARLAAKGYGLTLGVHSRLEGFAARVQASVPAGNVYVNRSMIGAVVGVQPFGGQGISGTGPKAGGPHYLARFATERTITINVAAQGGDPELLNL